MSVHEIVTARTRLTPVAPADLDTLHRLFVDPGVRRFLWDDEIVDLEVTRGLIETSVAQFAREQHGLWLARPVEGGDPFGFAAYWYFHEPPELEILYGLAPTHWGSGLAVEIAGALLDLGFGTLGFERVVGSTDAPNVASVRVMEKLGMKPLRRASPKGRPTVWFVIDADERRRRLGG